MLNNKSIQNVKNIHTKCIDTRKHLAYGSIIETAIFKSIGKKASQRAPTFNKGEDHGTGT